MGEHLNAAHGARGSSIRLSQLEISMTTPLEQARARLAEIAPDLKRLAELNRAHTAVEAARYDALRGEFDALEAREAELVDKAHRAGLAGASGVFDNPYNGSPSAARDAVLRGAERSMDVLHVPDAADRMTAIERMLRSDETNDVARAAAALADPAYTTAFMKVLRDPTHGHLAWSDEESRAFRRVYTERALAESGSGQYVVPIAIDPTIIITGSGAAAAIRSVANVKTSAVATYQGASAAQVTASVLAENAAFGDGTPTLTQISIPTYKGGAYIPASFEMYEDVDNLADDVSRLFSDAKANLEATLFTTGTGSSQPTGVMTAVSAVTASRVSPATGGTIAAGDIFTVQQSLPARFRSSPSARRAWIANLAVINKIRQFGTSNVYYAFTGNATETAPATLLGDALIEASPLSSSITTGQDVLLYGDFSRYFIVDRVGPTVEFIPNVFDQSTGRPSGTRAWLFHWRVGAACADTNAFRDLRL
jgi:HK97 family phage major capsid protein